MNMLIFSEVKRLTSAKTMVLVVISVVVLASGVAVLETT